MTADSRGPSPAGADQSTSVLARRVTLADLLEGDSFKEVMTAFADLYRVGVKVFDASGHKLVDIRVGNSQFCGYLWQFGATRQACTRLVTGLKNDPFPTRDGVEVARTVDCFSGLRYVVLPLLYEGDLIGRLIFGPYMPQGTPGLTDNLYQIEPKLDRRRAETLIEQVRRAPDDLVAKLLTNVQKIVDVLVFTSYRSMLTSQMHIEAVTASYHELEEKNRTLKENNERLQELDKLKSNFLATVSHELRTPLTSVIGYSEMLIEGMAGVLNDEQRDYVKTIMEKGETLLSMISQILDLSRIESGNLRMDVSDFSVKDVLKHATTSVIPQCQKKSITLDIDIDGGLPFYRGDKDKIGQIVVNLLGNSVKFTPQGGRITLRGKLWTGPRRYKKRVVDDGAAMLFDLADETFVRIDVQDSGVGIPQDKIDKVFERFYQVDNTSTREYGGTGLGLSIVKSFVEAHKGEIFAESEVGKGSTFTVLLPVS